MIIGKQNRDIPLEDICKPYNINPNNIPKHIAIIMDGNGRWAKKNMRPRVFGHRAGVESLRKAITACVKFNIHYLSVYAFSTENWKRPKKEVKFLMSLLKELTIKEVPSLKKQGARVRCLGDLSAFEPSLQESIEHTHKETKDCNTIQLNLMINYGSRLEITQACKKIAEEYKSGQITDIDENIITQNLYTKGIPDPEILIRTSAEYRISNFMLWQLSYSELFFIDTLWPEFNIDDLGKVLCQYQNRDRRFGGLS